MAPRSKLSVILHADVVGSTALVQVDEAVAHERMQDVFRRLSTSIAEFNGITHELRGDALVAEFTRASDAIGAALSFQDGNSTQNQGSGDTIRPEVRIGIALGEVVIADHTMTGAGVVLAQRLEQLAEPNGVVIQGAVYETVPRRLPYEYISLGDRDLKGFEEKVRAYSVNLQQGAELQAAAESEVSAAPSVADSATQRPSIAVLPFENMSSDVEQGYFADGMADDIITALSRFRWFFVIARNSSFTYKGRAVDVKQVARELGVRYILEGSVRKAGQRVRVTGQLIEAESARHIWAERYDREIADVFVIQDEITEAIVGAIGSEIDQAERERAQRTLHASRWRHSSSASPGSPSHSVARHSHTIIRSSRPGCSQPCASWVCRTNSGLRNYRDGNHPNESMNATAKYRSDDATKAAAAWFTRQEVMPGQ